MTFALGRTADELTVGDRASVSKVVSETDIYLYVGMTGDLNPLYTTRAMRPPSAITGASPREP